MNVRILTISIVGAVLCAPFLHAGDLSQYRGFQFDMSLAAAAKRAEADPSEAKVIHQRPAILQELAWQPQRPAQPQESESVKEVIFSFYNGQLSRMAVSYDRYQTEGLTTEDMIDAISVNYGTATRPAVEIIFPSILNESVRVLARWEDSQYSFNLVRSSYQGGFGLVAFSKRLEGLSQTAIVEAIRLEKEEAPQKAAETSRKQAERDRVQQAIARLVNKASFRP